jgi:phosphoserine phosphatase
LPGAASNLDLIKIEEALGRLTAPNLDRKGRENIINEIEHQKQEFKNTYFVGDVMPAGI